MKKKKKTEAKELKNDNCIVEYNKEITITSLYFALLDFIQYN